MVWTITITANNGDTYTPELLAPRGTPYPREIPEANGAPTLEIAVPQLGTGESWFDEKFENCDISVAKDGVAQPYTTLRDTRDSSEQGVVILSADGGDELDARVDESFGVIETHTAAEQVVTGNTSYGVDIPAPATTTTTETVRDRSGGLTSADLSPQKDTSPAYVTGTGDLTLHQTLHFHEPTTTLSGVNDTVEFDFTTEYSIPAGALSVGATGAATLPHVAFEASVDGTVIGEYTPIDLFTAPFGGTQRWVRKRASNFRLPPGDHTARFEVVQTSYEGAALEDISLDGVCVHDNRFEYSFDADLVNGPELYPSTVEGTTVALPPVVTTRAVTGLTFDGTYQDGEPVRVTLKTGDDERTGYGDGDINFADRGAGAEVEIGFRAYGQDSNQTPESGFKCTTLQGYTLDADLETMPLVVNERYQGTVADVLTELADTLRGDFVWTYDTDSNGDPIVRFVRTNSRTTSDDRIERYQVEKNSGTQLDEVKVIGGPVEVTGEQVRVRHNEVVDLQRDNLIEGSETVEQDGTVFTRGREYLIDYDDGTIEVLQNPARTAAIPDDSLVTVSYAYHPQAVVTRDGVTTPERTAVVDELPLRSDAAAALAGKQILDTAQTPRFVADAELRGDTVFSVVEELDSARLPGPNYEVVDITASLAGSTVRLEAQRPPGEVITAVENTIRNVARHVR